jgi:hypothetical protein
MALALLGMLVAAMAFAGLEEARVGEATRQLNRAFGAAEAGWADVVRGWDRGALNVLEPFPLDSAALAAPSPTGWLPGAAGVGSYRGRVYKLNGELYLVDIAGRAAGATEVAPGGSVSQPVRVLVRVRPVEWRIGAALVAGRAPDVAGAVHVAGADRLPPGWLACGAPDTIPAVMIDSTAGILPPEVQSLAATTILPGRAFGGAVGPVAVNGHCAHGVATNWGGGDGGPCDSFFPFVHVVGDASLTRALGQGILLVDGDLAVLGPFDWRGIVAVRGRVLVQTDPADEVHIWGALVASDTALVRGSSGGSNLVSIDYSKCAVMKALETVAWVAPLGSRGWIGPS